MYLCHHLFVDLCIHFVFWRMSGRTKRATTVDIPLPRLQSSEGKYTTSREIETVHRSFRRRRSCTVTEVARLVPSYKASTNQSSFAIGTRLRSGLPRVLARRDASDGVLLGYGQSTD